MTKKSIRDRLHHKAARARARFRGRRGSGPETPQDGPMLRQPVARLRKRLVDLEKEVQELRRLSHRLAELTDLVQELLVPAARRDDERVRELLDEYDPGR